MHRREFVTLLGGAAAAWSFPAHAQQAERLRRIGVLMSLTSDDPDGRVRNAAFLQGLQQSGWTDGRNIRIDYRWGGAVWSLNRCAIIRPAATRASCRLHPFY
jgi:putative ABC transport system substrate-binding protein